MSAPLDHLGKARRHLEFAEGAMFEAYGPDMFKSVDSNAAIRHTISALNQVVEHLKAGRPFQPTTCPHCPHPPHGPMECRYILSEDIDDTVGFGLGEPSGLIFTLAKGICRCDGTDSTMSDTPAQTGDPDHAR